MSYPGQYQPNSQMVGGIPQVGGYPQQMMPQPGMYPPPNGYPQQMMPLQPQMMPQQPMYNPQMMSPQPQMMPQQPMYNPQMMPPQPQMMPPQPQMMPPQQGMYPGNVPQMMPQGGNQGQPVVLTNARPKDQNIYVPGKKRGEFNDTGLHESHYGWGYGRGYYGHRHHDRYDPFF